MVARQFPWLLREEEGGARCRFVVVARTVAEVCVSGSICENGAGTMVRSVNGEVLRWLSETAARMEEDGGGAQSYWTREEDGVAVHGGRKT
ncbi:hypothetical protein DEO72_LG2g1713 [Vigna unguiculata]|uniref:Uncharacterized protein n=1 Tax=Vigna unguiculata TaxID=3917 RepID=A0A4D6KUK8_VIGUN|nr:hypothetical protein DEO72_LG2g1713 [Vigna unguiculata]